MTSILRVIHYFSKVQENVFKNLSFISFSSWISITSNLKKTEVKLEFFNWYWYAINGSKKNKELEEEYVMQFIDMQELITNIWKVMIKIKNVLNIEI